MMIIIVVFLLFFFKKKCPLRAMTYISNSYLSIFFWIFFSLVHNPVTWIRVVFIYTAYPFNILNNEHLKFTLILVIIISRPNSIYYLSVCGCLCVFKFRNGSNRVWPVNGKEKNYFCHPSIQKGEKLISKNYSIRHKLATNKNKIASSFEPNYIHLHLHGSPIFFFFWLIHNIFNFLFLFFFFRIKENNTKRAAFIFQLQLREKWLNSVNKANRLVFFVFFFVDWKWLNNWLESEKNALRFKKNIYFFLDSRFYIFLTILSANSIFWSSIHFHTKSDHFYDEYTHVWYNIQ